MRLLFPLLVVLMIAACKHPLAVRGEGDIVELRSGSRGCTFEESEADDPRCTENAVVDADYAVSYEPVPRPGWAFVGWEGTVCGAGSALPYCEYDLPAALVNAFDEAIPDLGFPPTVAVFEPVGTVTLSTNIALPMQAITLFSADLQAGNVAEVEFRPVDGSPATLALAPVLEDGQVSLAVPPVIDDQGSLVSGAVEVAVDGIAATATLFIQPLLDMSVDTGGLLWLADANDTLDSTRAALANVQALQAELDEDLSELADLLAAEITALENAISQFEATGVIQFDDGEGTITEFSGDELNLLDSLILHRALALAELADLLDDFGGTGSSPAPATVGGAVGALYAGAPNIGPKLRAAWERAMANFERIAADDPDSDDGAARIREAIASWEDAWDEASAKAERGLEEFGTFFSLVATYGSLAGNKAAPAFKVARKEAELAFSALWGKVNRLLTDAALSSSSDRENFDWTLDIASEFDKLVSLANKITGGRTSTLRKVEGWWKTLKGTAEAVERRICGESSVESEYLDRVGGTRYLRSRDLQLSLATEASDFCLFSFPVAGTYSTTYGTMTLSQSGSSVTGSYTGQEGQINGSLEDNILTGTWSEPSSARRCSSSVAGTEYWGAIRFEFTESGFSGSWDYCGESGGGSWNGTRQ